MQMFAKTGGIFFLSIVILMTSGRFLPDESSTPNCQSRLMLLKNLLSLNLKCIVKADRNYLASVNAGFDADNQQYFLERYPGKAKFPGGSYLFVISYLKPDSVTITVYAPEDQPWQWLKCRLRYTEGQISGRIIFQPDGECFSLPASGWLDAGEIQQTAMLRPE